MLVNGDSRLSQALALHPDVLEYVIGLNPHDFVRLRNPLMRRLMPPRITLRRIAKMTDTDLVELLGRIHEIAGAPLTDAERGAIRAASSDAQEEDTPGQTPPPEWAHADDPVVVDLLESDERLDADPMPPINRALNTHPSGTVILVKHKWEPQPLYDVWARTGVEHFATQVGADEWWVFIRRTR